MRDRKIVVEAATIANAVRADSHRCMIADSIRAHIHWAKYIMVDLQSVRFSNVETGKRFVYLTPPHAQKALLAFDLGKPVKPFTFTLNQGMTRTMRVRQGNYATTTRPPRKKRKGKVTRVMPAREREFGLRVLTETP